MKKPKVKHSRIKNYIPFFSVGVVALAIVVTVSLMQFQTVTRNNAASNTPTIYYGVDTGGAAQTLLQDLATFETDAGKRVAIYQFFSLWEMQGTPNPFPTQTLETIRQHGSIPMLVWQSRRDCSSGTCINEPRFSLAKIIHGDFDSYLTQWAKDAAAWNHPFFLEFDNQMNFSEFPYGVSVNGNAQGEFIQAWRHVHDIFVQNGASNVTWVWTPGRVEDGHVPIASLYPGDAYVDWIGTEVFVANQASQGGYRTFAQTITQSYTQLRQIAPSKPILIGDMGITEFPSTNEKAQWFIDALSQEIPQQFTAIRAVIYDNIQYQGVDFRIETSQASQTAFAQAINSFHYAANQYGCIGLSPIPIAAIVPPCSQPTGDSTPTMTPRPSMSATPTSPACQPTGKCGPWNMSCPVGSQCVGYNCIPQACLTPTPTPDCTHPPKGCQCIKTGPNNPPFLLCNVVQMTPITLGGSSAPGACAKLFNGICETPNASTNPHPYQCPKPNASGNYYNYGRLDCGPSKVCCNAN